MLEQAQEMFMSLHPDVQLGIIIGTVIIMLLVSVAKVITPKVEPVKTKEQLEKEHAEEYGV